MKGDSNAKLIDSLLRLVPADGGTIGNRALLQQLQQRFGDISEADYQAVRDSLVEEGILAKGKGQGGSVRLASPGKAEPLELATQEQPKDLVEQAQSAGKKQPVKKRTKGKKRGKSSGDDAKVLSYRHDAKRKNNPEVGMVDPDTDPGEGGTRWTYDPHIDPALQFDVGRAQVENLIDEALASGDEAVLRDALDTLKRMSQPYLTWTGKAERTSFDVDLVSLHVHERIDPATILAVARKRMKGKGEGDAQAPQQSDMFKAWFEDPLPYREAIDFYRHERGWSNRLIAGDSLQVMNSLIQKESLAGQVQMIYIDPPYGIKYGSNFQPFVNKRDVKDRKDEDLTQEPEMIKAFRDTWELGIHSYLTFLRDRLLLAKELLHQSGSIFLQISDENLHHAREIMDDVFGAPNFIALITFRTGSGFAGRFIKTTSDFLLWYGKSRENTKYRQLFDTKPLGEGTYFNKLVLANGAIVDQFTEVDGSIPRSVSFATFRPLVSGAYSESTTFDIEFQGRTYHPGSNRCWKTTRDGLRRLHNTSRITFAENTLKFVAKSADFPCQELTHVWEDTMELLGKNYVVQTTTKVLERCILMTTDPGDLIFDPTCGSGTTAFVAEKWGRRWMTCDTSRVAVTLAKQRLMTASYDYYDLKYPHEGLASGFIYQAVPHVTLKSIANNPEIDEIYEKMYPAVDQALESLNAVLRDLVPAPFEVGDGGRKGEVVDFSLPASRKTDLPSGEKAPAGALLEWEVPFDFPEVWPAAARPPFNAFQKDRQAMQRRMDESIAAHADEETLYDQAQVARNKLRVSGPFTVEAVPFPSVRSLESIVSDEAGGVREVDASIARSGESARQHTWRDELFKTGIRAKGGQMLKFAELESLPDTRYLHCTGHLDSGERVVVSFGPEYAALEQRQVEMAIREAGDLFPRPRMIVFCAFTFDPEAAKDIDATKGITALKVQMNTDLLTEDLKKGRSSNQSFWLMGQPEVELRAIKDGKYEVEVHGFDYFDPKSGELKSGGKKHIAAWSLDTDYDERSLFPRQVFFPMAGKKDGWRKLKKNIRAELDEQLLDRLHSTVSLPFEAGEHRKVAVKIVDDRGIESLKILSLD